MTKDFNDFLHLYACAVSGKAPEQRDYDLEKLFKIAKEQEVAAMLFFAVKKLYTEKKLNPKYNELFVLLNKRFISEIAFNIKKTQGAYKLCDLLEQNGIECCILKGDAVAVYYNIPESRISSDTDILIKSEYEKEAAKILENAGCSVSKREKNEHHFQAVYDGKHVMEIHISPYGKRTQTIILKDKVTYSGNLFEFHLKNGRKLKTLPPYENLIFLSAHFIKHFLFSGVGIRQISDLLMFADANKENIDFEKYFDFLKEIKFFKLISIVFKIGNDCFNTNLPIECEVDDNMCTLLLNDILSGGVFGGGKTRSPKFTQYLTLQMTKNAKKYSAPLFKRIFPPFNQMRYMYPFLNEKPYLLPIAYIIRGAKIFERFFVKDSDIEKKNKETIEFLKKFDIL